MTQALAEDVTQLFAESGYVILREVLDPAEVGRAREICGQQLTGTGVQEMMTSDFLAIDFFAGIALRPRVVDTVRRLTGRQIVLYPNCTARKNVYVPWHVDSTFVGADAGYVWEPGFVHVQAGLYLQDNDPVSGGGIDVVSGSHLMSFDGYGRMPADFSVAAHTLGESGLSTRVDLRAGDMVLWHARLMHASTPVKRPSDVDKFGIFLSYGRLHLRDNHRFMAQLAVDSVRTVNGLSQRIPRLTEIAHLRYPVDFPKSFREAAAAAGVTVVTL